PEGARDCAALRRQIVLSVHGAVAALQLRDDTLAARTLRGGVRFFPRGNPPVAMRRLLPRADPPVAMRRLLPRADPPVAMRRLLPRGVPPVGTAVRACVQTLATRAPVTG